MNQNDVVSVFETFTKQQAQDLFDNRIQNRNIRENKVNEYRDMMNTPGKWVGNNRAATPILLDKNGKLAGGQHRMKAFLKSDLQTIVFPVAKDVSKEELVYQDSNITRTTRDRINMWHQMPIVPAISASTLIAATKIIMQNKAMIAGTKSKHTDDESIADEAKLLTPVMIKLGNSLNKKSIITKHAAMVAGFIFAHDLMDPKDWDYCVEKTADFSNLNKHDPMYSFRDFVSGLPRGYSNDDRFDVFLKTLFCLRAQNNSDKVPRINAQKTVQDIQTWK